MTIDFTKPVRTVSGEAVRVLCTDRKANGVYPVLALVGPKEDAVSYTAEGRVSYGKQPFGSHPRDLENIPEPSTRWFNVYHSGYIGSGCKTKEGALRKRASATRVGKEHGNTFRCEMLGGQVVAFVMDN